MLRSSQVAAEKSGWKAVWPPYRDVDRYPGDTAMYAGLGVGDIKFSLPAADVVAGDKVAYKFVKPVAAVSRNLTMTTSTTRTMNKVNTTTPVKNQYDRAQACACADWSTSPLACESCHPVSGKALSRVFIELYRDHVAFVEFGQRPDIRALVEARDALLVEPANVDLLESPIGGSVLFFGPR